MHSKSAPRGLPIGAPPKATANKTNQERHYKIMGFGGVNPFLYNLLDSQKFNEPDPEQQQLSGRQAFIGIPSKHLPLPPYIGVAPRLDLLAALAPRRSAVHQAFNQCLANIELDPTRSAEASQHYNAIRQRLESSIPGVQVKRVGSFQKHTKIRPVTINGIVSPIDIDMIVCFGDAHQYVYGGRTGNSCLQEVRKALVQNRIYKVLDPEIDHPVVTLSYSNEFFIELIPCFRNKLDLESMLRTPASYLVCNPNQLWEDADYDYDSEYITNANKKADLKLIPAIKLVKQLVRNKGINLKSFQVELLCVRLLVPKLLEWKANFQIWEWQHLLTYFLQNANTVLSQNLSLPGSKTVAPQVVAPNSLGIEMKILGDQFAALSTQPPTEKIMQSYKSLYGERFPTS